MNKSDLLPCPFCGQVENMHVNEHLKYKDGSKVAEPAETELIHWCNDQDDKNNQFQIRIIRFGDDYASAAAAWNTRAG